MTTSPQVRAVLRCPTCQGELDWRTGKIECRWCGAGYAIMESGALDLRLKEPKRVTFSLEIGGDGKAVDAFDALSPLLARDGPEVEFELAAVSRHVSMAMLSHFTRAEDASDLAIDLGCGNTAHRPLLEKCGYGYVGVDYSHSGAPILADAHALPFADESFSFTISMAVLEHLSHPMVALRELYRVLKPGAPFIGTVAFLESFHGNSFYHHTHRGTANALLTVGFDIHHLGYGWIAPMSLRAHLFPGLQPRLGRALVWPLHAASTAYWRLGSWIRK